MRCDGDGDERCVPGRHFRDELCKLDIATAVSALCVKDVFAL
jgi:hypothetical protein